MAKQGKSAEAAKFRDMAISRAPTGKREKLQAVLSQAGRPLASQEDKCMYQRVLYFDAGKFDIKPEFQSLVACHARYLKEHPEARIRLIGNTDERELSDDLGERRGNSVSSAIQADGGSANQLSVVSSGQKNSICKEHDESCWSRNRRVEIVYTAM
ncbi:OmpA family protein [Rhodanobacter sp. DHB23]|uniref:OmpA family protein n=1 Tax=Rhodanobacter sp. DHB23 TaxID=2775923 RepID=UPI00177F522D|nr:OmpA family protein [Rhodanobacter sp. DHB23]MBD8874018.1 OmpA family protein [Rhodanobacter sp. DHB23]